MANASASVGQATSLPLWMWLFGCLKRPDRFDNAWLSLASLVGGEYNPRSAADIPDQASAEDSLSIVFRFRARELKRKANDGRDPILLAPLVHTW
jgi:hypothetical protein